MGRQAPKKYSKMGYFEKQQFTKDQAEKHGVDLKYETVNGRHEQVDWEASNAAVTKAIANDYDTRRSLEAASAAGNKKARKAGSISNIAEAVNAERFMAKTHKNRMGNTGAYSSANDEGNVTNYWVNKDRNKMMDSMSAAEQQKEAETGAVAPVSDRLQQDRDTVEEIDNKDYNIFNNNIDKGDNETQRTEAADAFLGKFKLDLKQKKNFQPVLPT